MVNLNRRKELCSAIIRFLEFFYEDFLGKYVYLNNKFNLKITSLYYGKICIEYTEYKFKEREIFQH